MVLGGRQVLAKESIAQQFQQFAPRWHRQSWELKRTLAEPFKGISTNGAIIPNLYPVESTGIPEGPVREAAMRFLSLLTPEQHVRLTFEVDDVQWRSWSNTHWYDLEGVSLQEMNDAQRNAFFALLQLCLSPRGYELARNAMRLNETLAELAQERAYFGEWRYNVSFFGLPSPTEPWGWQLSGHHNVINYFILGDQVVMTPQFIGGEPVVATEGKYKGTAILQDEQSQGLAFVNRLDRAAKQSAILNNSKTNDLNVAEAFKDNIVLDYAGVRVSDLPSARQSELLDLAELYVGNLDERHAKVKMDQVKSKLDNTWFAWIGQTDPGSVFYYRIHSPVVLIEFDHQKWRTLGDLHPEEKGPVRQHIHCVVRTPNGNDYGKDLLREHHLQQPHL